MLGYYLDLALRSFRRNVALTSLMVVAIAFGVGASMTTLTVLHVLSADPIPGKSHDLYYVQMDARKSAGYFPGDQPMDQMTRYDSEALLREHRAGHQAMMTGGNAAIEPDRAGLAPFNADARWTSTDFFTMFRVQFLAGGPWAADDDDKHARVIVISRPLAEKLFGTIDVVGRTIRAESTAMRIVGVVETWRPTPHFYDLHAGSYGAGEQMFAPISTALELKLPRSGQMNCWGSDDTNDETSLNAPCEWIQYWVELDSQSEVDAYHDYLVRYSNTQHMAGRFQRPTNVRLSDVIDWLAVNKVIEDDVKLQVWIAFGFLLVCLINTVGLLLTKFLRRSADIGVRRALGASKRSIFIQLLVEAGSIGVAGGLLGLGLAWLGLWAVRHQPTDYADLAQLDMPMLVATFALAVAASLLAGLLPAWRGCQVAPAIQLKSH